MAVKYHINEVDIYKFIVDTWNDNSSVGKILFGIGYSFFDEDDIPGMFVKRFTQKGGRFDIKDSFDDDTYLLENESFVPMGVSNLNANYLAHDDIKEITYEPVIEMLVYIENDITYKVIELTIQEIRAQLVQKQTTLDVEYLNLEGGENITETLKVITMSGEIDYGQIVTIQGRRYLSISMPLTLEVTNYGEYANQETIYLSVASVSSGAETEMWPIAWNYGVGIDVEGSQTLNDKSLLKLDRAKQIRHVPKTTAFGFSMAVQMDFRNPILYKIFKDSRKPTQATSTEIWTIKSEVTVYSPISVLATALVVGTTYTILTTETSDFTAVGAANNVVGTVFVATGVTTGTGTATYNAYVVDDDLTLEDDFLLDKKTPIEELSKGEKIVYALTFLPAWEV